MFFHPIRAEIRFYIAALKQLLKCCLCFGFVKVMCAIHYSLTLFFDVPFTGVFRPLLLNG